MPTGETLFKVFVLSSFLQLITNMALHMANSGGWGYVVLYGMITGCLGVIYMSVLNHLIRGESLSLKAALQVANIDKEVEEWEHDREYGVCIRAWR